MNSATVNWEGRFQRVKSRLALWNARKLTLLGKVLVLKADMLSTLFSLCRSPSDGRHQTSLMWFLLHDMCGTHKVSGPVVDSSRFCCIQMFPVLLHPDAEEAIRADASVRVTLVPEGGDLRVKLSQYADDTTLLLDSDECVVRALERFEDFGRVSGARLNIGKCTVKGGGRGVMLLRVDYQRVKGQ
ncbi:hypothetical protein Q8A73_016932 [Channa argus]|nr:hypothetical protein Q8A73_016932 [Channa argus]